MVKPQAGIPPSQNKTPAERGDNGRGPLPRDARGESRFTNVKEPGKGRGQHESPPKKSGRPTLSLNQKA